MLCSTPISFSLHPSEALHNITQVAITSLWIGKPMAWNSGACETASLMNKTSDGGLNWDF
jgi:hypothetical protein